MPRNDLPHQAEAVQICRDIWLRGWAEANAGNFSLRLTEKERAAILARPGVWVDLPAALPEVGGQFFLFTAGGQNLRHAEVAPAQVLGGIELDADGARYRTAAGFAGGGRPTSEIFTHLRAHAIRIAAAGGKERAVMHVHPTELVALSHLRSFDTASLTSLLWRMHAEGIAIFPRGIGYVPFLLGGSTELAEATAEALERRNLVFWELHGILASGPGLNETFGMIETAEKLAGIVLRTRAYDAFRPAMTREHLLAVAANYGVEPDLALLE